MKVIFFLEIYFSNKESSFFLLFCFYAHREIFSLLQHNISRKETKLIDPIFSSTLKTVPARFFFSFSLKFSVSERNKIDALMHICVNEALSTAKVNKSSNSEKLLTQFPLIMNEIICKSSKIIIHVIPVRNRFLAARGRCSRDEWKSVARFLLKIPNTEECSSYWKHRICTCFVLESYVQRPFTKPCTNLCPFRTLFTLVSHSAYEEESPVNISMPVFVEIRPVVLMFTFCEC